MVNSGPSNLLPQYGFGTHTRYLDLVASNPFIYRIYTPRPHELSDDTIFAVGHRFNAAFRGSPDLLPEAGSTVSKSTMEGLAYGDVISHMDWDSKSSSPFITTSFSPMWSFWEATRRYQIDLKHDVEIAIIDATYLLDRCVTAVELLEKGTLEEKEMPRHAKHMRCAETSQTVLVYGSIPKSALLASFPVSRYIGKSSNLFLRDLQASEKSKLSQFIEFCGRISKRAEVQPDASTRLDLFFNSKEREDPNKLIDPIKLVTMTSDSCALACWMVPAFAQARSPQACATVIELALNLAQRPTQHLTSRHRRKIEASVREKIRERMGRRRAKTLDLICQTKLARRPSLDDVEEEEGWMVVELPASVCTPAGRAITSASIRPPVLTEVEPRKPAQLVDRATGVSAPSSPTVTLVVHHHHHHHHHHPKVVEPPVPLDSTSYFMTTLVCAAFLAVYMLSGQRPVSVLTQLIAT